MQLTTSPKKEQKTTDKNFRVVILREVCMFVSVRVSVCCCHNEIGCSF